MPVRGKAWKTGVRALAVYNPIHYQELPELFMDFVCSLTGKSPSTTGAGSELAPARHVFRFGFGGGLAFALASALPKYLSKSRLTRSSIVGFSIDSRKPSWQSRRTSVFPT